MLVKSKEESDHVMHLMEIFNILRRFCMKLNLQKCVFGVESGKFIGFIVNHRGIEVNPLKIKALLDMNSPTSVKPVQSLTGRIAALNRFVSKSSNRCKEFFKAIKVVGKDLVWTPEFLEYSITAVLAREEDGQQSPVYYESKRLHDAEARYTNMEKLVYALTLASRKMFNNKGAGAYIVLVSPEGHHLMSIIYFKFHAINNDVKYEALINGLKISLEMGVLNLVAKSDSKLVVNQVNGRFQARGPQTELYLRCVDEEEGNYILREVHEGISGNYSGGKSLAMKILGQGYYWTTIKGDAINFGILKTKVDVKYAVVAVDYFTKWAEAVPLAIITAKKIKDFHNIKTKLEERKVIWPEEIPKVLWSYNTTRRSTTGESLFMLTYGYEAMLHVEVSSGSLRRDHYTEEDGEVNYRLHLDLLEEVRENSQLKLATYQQRAARYYNKKVKG
ncbi:uncharacterized protein LOC141680115 [Apium graveolens]|uniref:uncharacterized protein LOC141680115 n=1 Tax=Apium graveolens TaxID=4045 RepID=UPI003D7A2004